MRHTHLPGLVILVLFAVAAGCDDPEPTGNTNNEVGQFGGDCEDGDVRCTDQFGARLCPTGPSGYPGDDLALCEPKNLEEGILLHYGPEDYDDEAQVAPFLLEPFGEVEDCLYVRTTNDKPVYVNEYHGRMRPLSHHLIVTIADELPEGVEVGELTECSQGELVTDRWLLGSQDPQIDIMVEGGNGLDGRPVKESDPEYRVGLVIEPNTLLRINMHYVNTTDKEILREGWIHLQTTPKEEVETLADMITFLQYSIDIPPQSKGVETAVGRCRAPEDVYVHLLTGHFHENGTRFTVWHEKDGEEPEKVYETFDWDVPGNGFYTDRLDNPSFEDGGIWGGKSGYLHVKKGEYLSFQCEFDNPTDKPVRFGELGADQMCNVFGLYYPTMGRGWSCNCVGTVCL